jgi:hypothetical protein
MVNKLYTTDFLVMAKITFIKPNLETDAVRDPIRTCSYL